MKFNNWMTTLGGFLAGIPSIVLGSGLPVSPLWSHILYIAGGIGVLLIGLAAKDFNTHSTNTEVIQSTVKKSEGELPKV